MKPLEIITECEILKQIKEYLIEKNLISINLQEIDKRYKEIREIINKIKH